MEQGKRQYARTDRHNMRPDRFRVDLTQGDISKAIEQNRRRCKLPYRHRGAATGK